MFCPKSFGLARVFASAFPCGLPSSFINHDHDLRSPLLRFGAASFGDGSGLRFAIFLHNSHLLLEQFFRLFSPLFTFIILFSDIFEFEEKWLILFRGFMQMPPRKRSRPQPELPSQRASPVDQSDADLDDALVDKIADKVLAKMTGIASSTLPSSSSSAATMSRGPGDHAMAGTPSNTGDQLLSSLMMGPLNTSEHSPPPPGGLVPISAPLGVYVPIAVKEKIWRNEYVEIFTLLPPSFLGDQQASAAVAGRGFLSKRNTTTSNFTIPHSDYVTALMTLASIRAERMPHDAVGLLNTSKQCEKFTNCSRATPGGNTISNSGSKLRTTHRVAGAPSTPNFTCRQLPSVFAPTAPRHAAVQPHALVLLGEGRPLTKKS
jgi:hypothetical protein